MGDENTDFNSLLRGYLRENGVTQTELARRMGVNATTVFMWVSRRSEPTLYNLKLLVNATGLDANYWCGMGHADEA